MARILIIDDNAYVRKTLEFMLKANGHVVHSEDNGRTGLNRLEKDTFDLVITDILMPEVDGIEVIQTIKAQKNPLPVIALSGGGNKLGADDALAAARILADAAMRKPCAADELCAEIDRLVDN